MSRHHSDIIDFIKGMLGHEQHRNISLVESNSGDGGEEVKAEDIDGALDLAVNGGGGE